MLCLQYRQTLMSAAGGVFPRRGANQRFAGTVIADRWSGVQVNRPCPGALFARSANFPFRLYYSQGATMEHLLLAQIQVPPDHREHQDKVFIIDHPCCDVLFGLGVESAAF